MSSSGFSCASMTCVCSEVYSSLSAIGDGDAPSDLNVSTRISPGETRIFSPARSATLWIGLVDVVISRKPFSQIFSSTTIPPRVWMSSRTTLPRSPSIARNTVSRFGYA